MNRRCFVVAVCTWWCKNASDERNRWDILSNTATAGRSFLSRDRLAEGQKSQDSIKGSHSGFLVSWYLNFGKIKKMADGMS